MDSHEVPAFLHAAAGGIGGIMALSILYPMDNLRTRMQVEADSMPAHEKQSNEAVIASTLQKLLDMARSNEHALELQAVLSKLPEIGSVARERIAALEKRRVAADQPPTPAALASSSSSGGGSTGKTPRSSMAVLKHVLATEGAVGLYRGLVSGLLGMGVAWASYYYFYNVFAKRAAALAGKASPAGLGNGWNLAVGAGAGTVTCVVTNPLWVVNTRVKLRGKDAKSEGVLAELARLHREEGVAGLFQGLVPSLVLVSNPSVQFMCAELIKRRYLASLRARGGPAADEAVLGPLFQFTVGAASKLVSTLVTYPYQVIKTRLQRVENTQHTTMTSIRSIFREEGFGGFYKGMEVKMGQTVLTSAFMFVIYDMALKVLVRMYNKKPLAAKR
jgi:adenine nucleotide transporter 17